MESYKPYGSSWKTDEGSLKNSSRCQVFKECLGNREFRRTPMLKINCLSDTKQAWKPGG